MVVETEAASTHSTSRVSARGDAVGVANRGPHRQVWPGDQDHLIVPVRGSASRRQPEVMVTEVARCWGTGTA
jgi:hypothetical protein